jgi:4-hydroxy-tetrahydrodipicolinate synthase
LKLDRWMYPVLNLDRRSTFVQCGKLANQMFGQGTEHVRMPLRPLYGPERSEALAVIEHALATRPSLPTLELAAA